MSSFEGLREAGQEGGQRGGGTEGTVAVRLPLAPEDRLSLSKASMALLTNPLLLACLLPLDRGNCRAC